MDQYVLGEHSYGKAAIRLLALPAASTGQGVADLTAVVTIRGGTEEAYQSGDNARLVTTDGLRNLTTETIAHALPGDPTALALAVVSALSSRYPQFPEVEVTIEERAWASLERSPESGEAGDPERPGRGFLDARSERATGKVRSHHGERERWQGLEGVSVLLGSGSSFEGFLVDEFTTNVGHKDRPVAGRLAARWRVAPGHEEWATVRLLVRERLLDAFAALPSGSLQHLLTRMGEVTLDACEAVEEIVLDLESLQLAPVDERFGSGRIAQLYDVVERPFGQLRSAVARRGSRR